ncbi:putative ankyrin repeat protein RF_0381 [Periplaneta americana]|uniref:putative ankyrin repeat protein RF_0381 n=1 Tax=Periplaneta americana TaxID=6978 RepID=UPI0037E81C17
MSCAAVENPERSSVTWEYLGCDVVIRDANSKLLKEFNQCGELSELKSRERKRLLLEAVEAEDISKIKSLLLLGTRVDYNLKPEGSPLCAASLKGNVEISLLLLNTGASVSWIKDLYHSIIGIPKIFVSPIECAALSGSIQLVQIFLDRGANILDKYPDNNITVAEHLNQGSFPVPYSLKSKISLYASFIYPRPLHAAASSGSLSLVQYLIDLGLDLFSTDFFGNTPLFYAARSGSVELVQLLLSLGSHPLFTNRMAETPIVYATHSGSLPMFELFLQWGANIMWKGIEAESLLHIAAGMGHLSLVQKLIGEGLDVTARDDNGRTPLHYAASCGHLSVVQALINAGARASIVDQDRHTALYYAKVHNRIEVKRWLSRLNTWHIV